jgi:tRNA threonylcarbamoyladenosine biosynthesis protein TsaB
LTFDRSFLVLGIDTSGEYCSVGLARGGKILGEVREKAPQAHSDKLIPFIDKILKGNNLKIRDVNAVAVSLGPGCFTGLRVGAATAKALAQALEIPIIGIPTLDVIALNAINHRLPTTDCIICPITDARKEQIYTAEYRCRMPDAGCRMKKITEDSVITIEDLLKNPGSNIHNPGSVIFLGNAIPVYGDIIKQKFGSKAMFAPEELWYPSASNVAIEGYKKLQKNKKGDNLFKLKPIYVREPDIRKPKKSV